MTPDKGHGVQAIVVMVMRNPFFVLPLQKKCFKLEGLYVLGHCGRYCK